MSVPAAPLPRTAELRSALHAVIVAWHDREASLGEWPSVEEALPAPAEPAWAALAHRLQLINTFQWHEEDRSRAIDASDELLAAVKRSIDASNRRRVQQIEAVDAWFHGEVSAAGLDSGVAPVVTETPASILDRLTILRLKIYHVDEALAATGDPGMRGRLELLTEQYDDLAAGLDRLQDEILAGRLRLKLYRQVKVYRDGGRGDLRADVS